MTRASTILAGAIALLLAPASALRAQGLEVERLLEQLTTGQALTRARAALRRDLPRRVGPARRWEIRFDRRDPGLRQGQLRRLEAVGTDVRAGALVIPRLELTLKGVELDRIALSLVDADETTFAATLSGEAVSRFLRERERLAPDDLRVSFREGAVLARAGTAVAGAPIEARGTVAPLERGVAFRATPAAPAALERKLNPLADFSGLRLPVRVTRTEVEDGRLLARGTAELGPE